MSCLGEMYGVPDEAISCPQCSRVYGHHNTKVSIKTEVCSKCAKFNLESNVIFVRAQVFLEQYLGFKKLTNKKRGKNGRK